MRLRRLALAILGIASIALCTTTSEARPRRNDQRTRTLSTATPTDSRSTTTLLSGLAALEGTAWGLNDAGQLVRFKLDQPERIIARRSISGLADGEVLLGIDVRPRTGELFALSDRNRLYQIDPLSGAARMVGGGVFVPGLDHLMIGIDFNPVPDRLRVVSARGQNLRLNPDTGAVAAVDSALTYDAADPNAGQIPQVAAAAYTNNFLGAPRTTLYVIDGARGTLATQGSLNGAPISPNSGRLFTVGALGTAVGDALGFDIASATGVAYLTRNDGQGTTLYRVDLMTAMTTAVGPVGSGERVLDLAIAVRPEIGLALTEDARLLVTRAGTPGDVLIELPLRGVPAGEQLVGFDLRPRSGALYALSNASRLYLIDIDTGLVTPVGAGPLTPPLAGGAFGIDFNPVPDRIRVVSETGQNLRLNPDTGAVAAIDSTLAFAPNDPNSGTIPQIVAAGYTDNVAGSTRTTLYVLDANLDVLALQGSIGGAPNSPNGGQLTTIGRLGIDADVIAGFDIAPRTDAAFAAITAPGGLASQLYTINLSTGVATSLGNFPAEARIVDFAIGFVTTTPIRF
jgi:hypothetical protein